MSKNKQLKKEQFLELFTSLCYDTLDSEQWPDETGTDFDDAYETYVDLYKQIKSGDDFALTQMNRMSEMNKKERLYWRMCLAEEGIEMTPRQVDEYIVLLEIALSFTE